MAHVVYLQRIIPQFFTTLCYYTYK